MLPLVTRSLLASHFQLRSENNTVEEQHTEGFLEVPQSLAVPRGDAFPGRYQHQHGSPLRLFCPLLAE